ncbi:hypothetical protein SRM_00875 [Salinibacter ruber M8]|uniref:Uncharacterized protein n=1 Tax=Salinibacter ruber (strain M8) TaxID=761659 RepID=D5H6Z1_SALRM|nr:hypothetical protein SRM_00875 [Salinibacter ruber M8]
MQNIRAHCNDFDTVWHLRASGPYRNVETHIL